MPDGGCFPKPSGLHASDTMEPDRTPLMKKNQHQQDLLHPCLHISNSSFYQEAYGRLGNMQPSGIDHLATSLPCLSSLRLFPQSREESHIRVFFGPLSASISRDRQKSEFTINGAFQKACGGHCRGSRVPRRGRRARGPAAGGAASRAAGR